MAAVSVAPDAIQVTTLSGTANVAQEFTFDADVRRVELRFTDGAGTSRAGADSLAGTDGQAQITNAITIFENTSEVIQIAGRARVSGGQALFVSSSTSSAIVEVRTYGASAGVV